MWKKGLGGLGSGMFAWAAKQAMCQRDEWDCEVDFIVVGAGSSGCALATRLAQMLPQSQTLLLEAGDHDNLACIQTARDYFGKVEKVFGSERDWSYASEAQTELNGRALYWPRGKVVGGCSSFNTMVYMRGDPADYDRWFEILGPGFEGWDYEGMLPYFRAAETHPHASESSEFHHVHGNRGPMTVAPLSHKQHDPEDASHMVTRVFTQAAVALGEKRNLDFAAGTEGVGINDVNAANGRRCNTSSYLRLLGCYPTSLSTASSPQGGFSALSVWLRATTRRILFNGNRAEGVEVKFDSPVDDQEDVLSEKQLEDGSFRMLDGKMVPARADGTVRIRAKKEIILCCGAVDSPKLLLLSGVGCRSDLQQLGIPVVSNLPGVGRSLKDHLHVPMCYRIPGGVVPHRHSNICEGTLFTKLDENAPAPDLQVHCGVIFFEPDGFSPLGEGFTLTPSLIHPKSVGTIKLRSADPDEKPLIEPNYLSDPDGYDLQQLVEGVKHVRRLGWQMLDLLELQQQGRGSEHFPGSLVQSDAEIADYVRQYCGTMYHPTSTCKIGRQSDPFAVLDSKLRVRNCDKLRVCDASVMPEIVGANTNATCVALGEKGAQIVATHYRAKTL